MQLLTALLALLVLPAVTIMLWERIVFAQVPRAWSVYKVTGIIGTPIHELAHAFVCLLFGLRITDMKLYAPDAQTGRMGYVHFMYNPGSVWHRLGCLVQGVAPLIIGGVIVSVVLDAGFVAAKPASDGQLMSWIWTAAMETVSSVWWFAQQGPVHLAVALALVIISMHAIPSMHDVRIGVHGLLVVLIPMAVLVGLIHYGSALDSSNGIVARAVARLTSLVEPSMWWLLYAACSVTVLAVLGSLVFILAPAIVVRALRGQAAAVSPAAPGEPGEQEKG